MFFSWQVIGLWVLFALPVWSAAYKQAGCDTPEWFGISQVAEDAPGIGLIAVKSGAMIQPVKISGAREALPRGSGKIRFARITVTVGKPIRLTPEELKAAKGKDDYDRIAKRIMSAIREL